MEFDTTTVCVVGLGYVGVPLAFAFDDAGYDVIGYDIDEERIESFRRGTDPTGEVDDERVAAADVEFTAEPISIERADYVLITVPTPLDGLQNPELDYVRSAGRSVGEHLSEGTTVVLESTVYPGVTRNVLAPVVEAASGMAAGEGFNVGYSPERLSPGSEGKGLQEVVKVVGADTDETLSELSALYESIVDAGVYEAPTLETAEAAKVLENVQRDVNIALINELAIICEHMDLDTHEVIEAAATKWNFHEYTPGLVGGHCIPVDPLYLAHGSERAGFSPKLILQGREINEYMPKHVAELAIKALNETGKVLRDSRLLVLGISYKPNVGDIRTSEVSSVITALADYGVESVVYDPVADDAAIEDAFGVETTPEPIYDGFDGIVLATPHDELRTLDFVEATGELAPEPVFVDVHGATDEEVMIDAGYEYRSL